MPQPEEMKNKRATASRGSFAVSYRWLLGSQALYPGELLLEGGMSSQYAIYVGN